MMASGSALNEPAAEGRGVVTRFAPSPTGYLHIGGARTALFNWLFARHHGGTYLLRIEDTDRARSTEPAIAAIFDGLDWLGLGGDEPPVFQFAQSERHAQVAQALLAAGQAYRCYLTPEELAARREQAQAERRPFRIVSEWRDADPASYPENAPFVVRIKAPRDGETVIEDQVQGRVTVQNADLDDFVILRSDGTPTYMLAVVVDDHDMGVTHVIRGDDHLNNAFRQLVILRAMHAIEGGWPDPVYAHIPLIHGEDGKKLSKRKNAAAVEEYRDMGYLPEAMRNYLLRLGWSHGDDELISDTQAIEWFNLESIGKSPSQLDFTKLKSVNQHYIKAKDNNDLYFTIKEQLENKYGPLTPEKEARFLKGLNGLKERAQTLIDLVDNARFYVLDAPLPCDEGAAEKLKQDHAINVLQTAFDILIKQNNPDIDGKAFLQLLLEKTGYKMGQVGPVLRAALTGTMQSPDMTEIISALGTDELKKRLKGHLA